MSLEYKIDQLIEQVFLLTGKVEQRAKINESYANKTSQTIAQAEQTVSRATQDIQRITADTLSSAIQSPVGELDHSLKIMRDNLMRNANDVERHMQESVAQLKRVVWLAIGAFALAGVVVAGVSVYATMQANQQIQKTEWIGNINAAIANGKLTACPDGGICAVVDKKQIRLDK